MGSCITLNDLSNRICVPSQTEDLNLSMNIQNIYHATVNVSLMVENITQIKSGAKISVGVCAKIKKT